MHKEIGDTFVIFGEKDEVWRAGLILLSVLSNCGWIGSSDGGEYMYGAVPGAQQCLEQGEDDISDDHISFANTGVIAIWDEWFYTTLPTMAKERHGPQARESAFDFDGENSEGAVHSLFGHLFKSGRGGLVSILKKMLTIDAQKRPTWAQLHVDMERFKKSISI